MFKLSISFWSGVALDWSSCKFSSFLFTDFGDEFIVNDKDGEDAKEVMIKSVTIKDEKTAEVCVLDGLRHDFSDHDLVELIEVVGLDGINKKQYNRLLCRL